LKEVNWIGEHVASDDDLNGREILVRVRSTREPVPATLRISSPARGGSVIGAAKDEGGRAAPSKTTLISTIAPKDHAGETPAVQVWCVDLATPEEGVAPGQAAVFYDPQTSRVLGGGWIMATETT
jgi:tRNA-specific 2-thiouridylase